MWPKVARARTETRVRQGTGIHEYDSAATVFELGAGDGNRTRTVSLGRVSMPPCSPALQRYWRPQLTAGGPYRPGLVARVWPGSLGSRAETYARWPELFGWGATEGQESTRPVRRHRNRRRLMPGRGSPRPNGVSHYQGWMTGTGFRFRDCSRRGSVAPDKRLLDADVADWP